MPGSSMLSAAELHRGGVGVVEVIVHSRRGRESRSSRYDREPAHLREAAAIDAGPIDWMLPLAMTTSLIFFRSGAGSVDDAHVVEDDDRRVHGDERRDVRRRLASGRVRQPGTARQQSRNVDRKAVTSNGKDVGTMVTA